VDGWTAGGGTSTYAALSAAYADPAVEAVYLLSDGMPNDQSAATILAHAITWSKGKTVPLHTVALVEGGSESSAQKSDAMKFMKDLADGTGGVYRGFGP
jgi:succinyl-CoA synthetase alpha subunit